MANLLAGALDDSLAHYFLCLSMLCQVQDYGSVFICMAVFVPAMYGGLVARLASWLYWPHLVVSIIFPRLILT